MDWQLEKTGAAMTLVRNRDSVLLGFVHILGRRIGDTTWAQPGLALVEGLAHLGQILIRGSGWYRLFNLGELRRSSQTIPSYTVRNNEKDGAHTDLQASHRRRKRR